MKPTLAIWCGLAATVTAAHGTDEAIDRLDAALTWTARGDTVRAHVSGLLDLEAYQLQQPTSGLFRTDADSLLNSRLTLFLDAQLGSSLYVFAQSRVDRGFDPGVGPARIRMDEYALRFTPRPDGVFNLQIGKFATVVGNWVARHHSWNNPFITAPLPYENLLGLFDKVAGNSTAALIRWTRPGPPVPGHDYYLAQSRVPIVWGPSYTSGAAISGVVGPADYAFEVKNASLSSRPAGWDVAQTQWQHPTYSGRLGYRPDESWYFGFSASTGTYLSPAAQATLGPGDDLSEYRETVWAQDIGFAWHHFQFWAEAFEASYAIPEVGDAKTMAYYLEAKYKFTPQFSGAVRWNQQLNGDLPDGSGGRVPWGRDTWRIDVAPNYRFTPHTELKLQYSLQFGGIGPRNYSHLTAAQFVIRF
jgi:hypothetical protein